MELLGVQLLPLVFHLPLLALAGGAIIFRPVLLQEDGRCAQFALHLPLLFEESTLLLRQLLKECVFDDGVIVVVLEVLFDAFILGVVLFLDLDDFVVVVITDFCLDDERRALFCC